MIPWDVCILPNEEGGLWLIDVVVQGKPARFWQQNDCDVLGRFSHLADLIEIISSPHLFQFRGSSMLKSIWSTWKCVAKCVYWIYTSTGCHGYLVIQPSWCWKGHGQCFLEIPQYQASRLSRQGILFWKDLQDSYSRSWFDWRVLALEKALLSSDRLTIWISKRWSPWRICLGSTFRCPVYRGWCWSFCNQLLNCGKKLLYFLLHQKQPMAPVLNGRWTSSYSETKWIHGLHSLFCLIKKCEDGFTCSNMMTKIR